MGQPRDESLADEGHGDGGQDELECLCDRPVPGHRRHACPTWGACASSRAAGIPRSTRTCRRNRKPFPADPVPAAAGTVHAGYSRGVRSEKNRRASGRPYLPRRGPQRSMRASLGGPGGVRMSSDAASSPLALVEAVPPLPSLPRLWGVVLAGGEGVRLRALARQICGDERPKQYLPLQTREAAPWISLIRPYAPSAASRSLIWTQFSSPPESD